VPLHGNFANQPFGNAAVTNLVVGPGAAPGGVSYIVTPGIANLGVALADAAPATDIPAAFADDFNRADGVIGASWQTTANSMTIVSNQVTGVSTSSLARWAVDTYTENLYSQGTYLGGANCGVGVAMSPMPTGPSVTAADSFYIFRQLGAGAGIAISSKVANSTTYGNLATSATNLVAGDVIRLEYLAGVLTAYINGVSVLTFTPASPITGQRGVGFASNAQAGVAFLDNWSGGDLATAPAQGLALVRTAGDSAPATDVTAATVNRARSASDSAPATGVAVTTLAAPRSVSDSAPASGVTVTTAARSGTTSDSAPAADTQARASAFARTTSDSAPASDTTAGSLSHNLIRTASDSAPATDVVVQTSAHPRAPPDTASGTDTVTTTAARSRPVSDSAPATDTTVSVTRSLALPRAVADSAPATVATTATAARARSTSDSAPATDTTSGAVGVNAARATAESANAKDAPASFADNFNRADGALGSNWVTAGSGPDTIGSNQVVGGTTTSVAGWAFPTSTDDQQAQATWRGGAFAGVVVAAPLFSGTSVQNSGTWYALRQGGTPSGAFQLVQKDLGASTFTTLASTATSLTSGDVIRLTYIDGVLTGYVNGVATLTATPAVPIFGQRYVGFAHNLGTQTGVAVLDDWSGGDIATATTTRGLTQSRGISDSAPAVDTTAGSTGNVFSRSQSDAAAATDSPTSFADNFNRADGALGANWQLTTTPPTVGTNQVVGGSASGAARWAADTATDDQFSQATYLGGTSVGVAVAMPSLAGTPAQAAVLPFYTFRQLTAGGGVAISIKNAPSNIGYTVLVSSATNLTAGDVIRLEYVGHVLTAKINVTTILTTTPTTPITGQRGVGLNAIGQTGVALLDNWSGGDVATTTLVRSLAVARSGSDSAPATDTDARSTSRARAVSDSAPATDTTSRFYMQFRTTAEALGPPATIIPDYPGALPGRGRPGLSRPATAPIAAVSLPSGTRDTTSAVVAHTLLRTTSDSAPASDTDARALTQARAETDAAPASDVDVRSALAPARTTADSAPAVDTDTRSLAQARSQSDAAPATDVDVRSALGTARSISDSAPATDTATRSSAQARSASDSAPATDTTAPLGSRSRTASDSAPAVDTAAANINRPRSISDSAPATDTSARVAAYTRTETDAAPAADTGSGSTSGHLSRSQSESAPAVDTTSATGTRARGAADSAPATDATIRASAYQRTRSLSESAPASDVTARANESFSRSLTDTAPAADLASRALAVARTALDACLASDTTARGAAIHGRSQTDPAPASDSELTRRIFFRVTADSAAAIDEAFGLVVPWTAPPDRTYVVRAETRRYVVEGETRRYVIKAARRRYLIKP
jgi:hypothetical protein